MRPNNQSLDAARRHIYQAMSAYAAGDTIRGMTEEIQALNTARRSRLPRVVKIVRGELEAAPRTVKDE